MLLVLGAMCSMLAPRAEAMVADRYAAQVNTRVITVSDVLGAMGPLRQQLMETYTGADLDNKLEDAFQKSLDQLIERALILEDFSRQEQKLPEQVVDGRINEIIHDRFNNNRAAFFEALTEERLTIDEWRSEAKDHIIISMLRRKEVMDKVVVTPGEVRAAYEKRLAKYTMPEQIHLRAIVLHRDTKDAEQTLRDLRKEIEQGAKFEDVARLKSEGPGAKSGGDWGWLQPGDVRKELKGLVAEMKPGQLSPVMLVGDEYYLIKLEARQAAQVKPLEAVYGELETTLRQNEAERIYKDWIKRLKQKYYVKIFPLT